MKHKTGKTLTLLLTLAMLVGLMPGMGMTAYADNTETLLTTITATGTEQASYNPENVATVSFSYTTEGSSAYTAIWGWWGYGWSATVNAAEGYNITKCIFYDDANRTATDSEAPFVVETTEEDKTPKVNGTPILAYTSKGIKKIEVYGYATPATYTITVHPGANGAAGVSKEQAAAGERIEVTATPFSGYEVSEILWSSDGGGTKIDITDTASFVIPAANVDVWVNFAPVGGGGGGGFGGGEEYYGPTQRGYRVRLAPVVNGSVILAVDGWSTSTEMSVVPTTLVCVYPTPAPGYVLESITWGPEGGAGTDITQNQSFVMPSMDVVVNVRFRPA